MSTKQPLQTLMVTSPSPYEGKTTVAISLAITMSQSGKKVLLIDSDLRRPRIHNSFDLSSNIGVTSILVDDRPLSESVQPTKIEGLDLLSAGPIQPNPSELLQTREFAQMIDNASSQYDWVIFDSPPLGSVTDPSVIGSQVSGAILVVQGDATTRDKFHSAVKQLRGVGANLLGAVFNGADLSDGKYGYGKGGYYYYGNYDSNTELDEDQNKTEIKSG